ncbi:restriction endonuclease subunit S [Pseudomonas rubra]|uniref:Restriction endonuclease subunit S n=1 Tax=Pseudomonas rubra TaxID=2942627 RepID=A0ABT5P1P9_9PSED|nr:restriction endonuclease subunit S [Pseudomonas rubra]MDD1012196.1 restriction endonuclease subunit S [Pseudomonas rubra]MDD1038368.1 restriction endonuclease subunit S [Pseudomonas rubra]MDD1153405.1 restriction endonuclease subunit S [Pseudomonas rubra]
MSQFKPYPAYQDSGVEWLGEVPKHWMLTPIKHLALLNPRKSDFAGDTEQLCSFVPMEKLKTGVVQLDEERPIEEVIGGYTYFEDGDVLQAKVTPCFENKNIAIAKGLTNGIGFGSSEINVLRPFQGVTAEYLYYRVQEDSYMSFCSSNMIGAGGLKRVPTDVINNFKVAAPELFEQTQISRFLDHETARIDALIEEQQRLIELLKEKRQALISHAVTKGLDPAVPMKDSRVEWLGEVPAHWAVAPTSYRYEIQLGRMLNEQRAQGEHLKPYLRVLDVQWNSINTSDLPLMDFPPDAQLIYRLKNGDLLVNEGGSYVGRSAIWRGDLDECYYQKALHRLRARDAKSDTAEFFLYVMEMATQRGVFIAGGNQTTIDHLTAEQLRKYRFAFPPLKEQLQIAEFISTEASKISNTTSEAENLIVLLQERRSALISAAVTGKVDVRGWQPPASVSSPELEEAV